MKLSEIKTYVYIDVSNIRYACLRSCKFNIDFIKLYEYLIKKYPGTQEVRYYEGISANDEKKLKHFQFLEEKIGYKVCPLLRKSYLQPAVYSNFKCKYCEQENSVQILPETIKLKSNVDVFLASDMISCAAKTTEPTQLILVSCDGDYAEAIHSILDINDQIFVTILATPMTRKNNCLSSRLQVFSDRRLPRTTLVNIASIKDRISQSLPKD